MFCEWVSALRVPELRGSSNPFDPSLGCRGGELMETPKATLNSIAARRLVSQIDKSIPRALPDKEGIDILGLGPFVALTPYKKWHLLKGPLKDPARI